MQYDVITIDTNIFRKYGYFLEGGMLGQLSQFKEGLAQMVLSEIVARELYRHLTTLAQDAATRLGAAVKDAIKSGLLMGECTAERDVEFESDALVSFEGDFSSEPPQVAVTTVELTNAIDTIDFGEIGPDYAGDMEYVDEPD
jgi:hypothetical protein